MSNFKGIRWKWIESYYESIPLTLIDNKEKIILDFGTSEYNNQKAGKEPNQKNKNLIAHAPEMLEMLERMMVNYDKGTQTYLDCKELIKKATEI